MALDKYKMASLKDKHQSLTEVAEEKVEKKAVEKKKDAKKKK